MLQQWVQGTGMIDLVIAVTVVEVAGLALYRRHTGHGVALRDYGLNLLSGMMLMLALRSHAAAAPWAWTAAFLLAAGVAHAADLRSRWIGPKKPPAHQ